LCLVPRITQENDLLVMIPWHGQTRGVYTLHKELGCKPLQQGEVNVFGKASCNRSSCNLAGTIKVTAQTLRSIAVSIYLARHHHIEVSHLRGLALSRSCSVWSLRVDPRNDILSRCAYICRETPPLESTPAPLGPSSLTFRPPAQQLAHYLVIYFGWF
jgi:hypothetical protein